jgi:hypothetical protein
MLSTQYEMSCQARVAVKHVALAVIGQRLQSDIINTDLHPCGLRKRRNSKCETRKKRHKK